jgi:hypothetical protein
MAVDPHSERIIYGFTTRLNRRLPGEREFHCTNAQARHQKIYEKYLCGEKTVPVTDSYFKNQSIRKELLRKTWVVVPGRTASSAQIK